MKTKNGFALLSVLLAILALAIAGGVAYNYYINQTPPTQIAVNQPVAQTQIPNTQTTNTTATSASISVPVVASQFPPTTGTSGDTPTSTASATIDVFPLNPNVNTPLTITGTAWGLTGSDEGAVNILLLGPNYTGSTDLQTLQHISVASGGGAVPVSNGRWTDGTITIRTPGKYLIFVLDLSANSVLAANMVIVEASSTP